MTDKEKKSMEIINLQDIEGLIEQGREEVKDKIKAKIEEYKELLYSYKKDLEEKLHYVDKESMNCIIAQIQVLQSLLEKE